MEHIKSKKEVKKQIVHEIYCDMCGEFLGESVEYADGYYENWGEFVEQFYIRDRGWYIIRKNFCKSCRQEFIDNLIELFKSQGFKKDGD